MYSDNATELITAKVWRNLMEKHGYIKQRYIEPGSLWQNAAELKIEEIKKETLKAMPQTNTPRRLWDFAA